MRPYMVFVTETITRSKKVKINIPDDKDHRYAEEQVRKNPPDLSKEPPSTITVQFSGGYDGKIS